MQTTPIPTLGRNVLYVLKPVDVYAINQARSNSIATGNQVEEGQVYPATVVRVWSDDCVNLQVALDGTDTHWATSINLGLNHEHGTFHWPVRG